MRGLMMERSDDSGLATSCQTAALTMSLNDNVGLHSSYRAVVGMLIVRLIISGARRR
jgi:hypothetical protein